jgi:hypothetical protein
MTLRKEESWPFAGCLLLMGVLLCVLCPLSGRSQGEKQPAGAFSLDSLSDEFNQVENLPKWTQFHDAEGYPSKIKSLLIQQGLLHWQVFASGWYADYQAPFFFKTVQGDFDVETRIKVSGLRDSLPNSEWSLAGLMIREPKATSAASWQPRAENWLFLTTGVAQPKGIPVFEVKSTNNSLSNLKLRPAKAGWVSLRVIRIQASFVLLYRYDGEPWRLVERFYRPLLPPALQVGLNAYSGWNEMPLDVRRDPARFNDTLLRDLPADLLVQVDYVRFRRPGLRMEKFGALIQSRFPAPFRRPGDLLSDYSLSNEEVLQLLGIQP